MARALTSDELPIFDSLKQELGLGQAPFDRADAYYDGLQRLEQLGLAIPPELARFTVIVNWPRVVVDSIADRLDVKGFRLAGTDVGDAELWRLWQANGMDESDLMGRLDYLIYGRTYKCIGANEADPKTPLMTVESPRQMITRRDARTGRVTEALRLYDVENGVARKATWYRLNETLWIDLDGTAEVTDTDGHGMDCVPVVPTFRRRRTTIPAGRTLQGTSAMEDVIPIADAAARNISNAQLGQETHAVPQRAVLGASKGDFVDQQGKQLTVWETYFGAVWALQNKDAKIDQFDASDMKNFETMMDLYARLASGVSGLPNYFGLAADDAASADAIRSRESRLVKIAERDQVALGNSDEEALRIAMRVRDGSWSEDLVGMETLWYDAGTPTTAARADATVKLFTATDGAGRSLLPREMAMEELGWSPAKITRALELLEREERDPYLAAMTEKDRAVGAAGASAGGA
ncbi:phage portal protein [Cellulomonas denverensis]|uniref:phage portal protein n=1 Tax=Cellulomonas denverensis TaxID=264297 RepID=UPI0035EDF6E0